MTYKKKYLHGVSSVNYEFVYNRIKKFNFLVFNLAFIKKGYTAKDGRLTGFVQPENAQQALTSIEIVQ